MDNKEEENKGGFFSRFFGGKKDTSDAQKDDTNNTDVDDSKSDVAENAVVQDTAPKSENQPNNAENISKGKGDESALKSESQSIAEEKEDKPEEKKGFFSNFGFGRKDENQAETEVDKPQELQRPAVVSPTAQEVETSSETPEIVEQTLDPIEQVEPTREQKPEPEAQLESNIADVEAKIETPAEETEYPAKETAETLHVGQNLDPINTDHQTEIKTSDTPPETEESEEKQGFFSRLTSGLSKTSAKLTDGITGIFTKRKLDDDTIEELEDLLISADLGVNATMRITGALAKDRFDKEITVQEVRDVLAGEIIKTLEPLEKPLTVNTAHQPHIILMTGVNGAGKTTTIGKLALKFKSEGKSVMMAAGDTFRAAAIDQLKLWGDRTNTRVVTKEEGSDAASLAYDAVQQAIEEKVDVLMIDTAGRLQNRSELMDELAKIVRVIKKLVPEAPHDTLLVLDATVGQNALSQTETFSKIAGVTGLVMTKLDGTARGGVLVALADKFNLPIHFIGVGESVEDLQNFIAANFAKALTDDAL